MVMVFIKVTGNNLQKAIGIFNKKVKQAGIIQEVYRRQEYLKPSMKRKLKKEKGANQRKNFQHMKYFEIVNSCSIHLHFF